MKTQIRRAFCLLLVLSIVLSCATTAFAGSASKNYGIRHQLCTALSAQAKSYYTGNYTYAKLSALAGDSTGSCLSAVTSPLFKSLHNLMDDTMTYSVSYKNLVDYWPDTDANNGSYDAVLFYSDEVSSSYNREHVWPKSRASFYQQDGGCDLHHLRPTNSTINSTRNNFTMGNVKEHCSSYSTKDYGGNTVLWYNSSYTGNNCNGLVEVNDNIKGDVARILLYVYVRWEERNLFEKDPNPKQASNDSGGNDGKKVIESLETLLEWMEEDPVDTWEMGRNDSTQKVQGNRNVFIDYPEFAWLLFDQDMPYDMPTPSGEAENSGYPITALSDNTAHGTVTLDNRTVTATPAYGYEVTGYTLSPEDAATVTRNGNIFKLSNITEACTITIHFGARTPATINYTVPEGVSYNGTTSWFVGDSAKLATVSGTPAAADHDYRFVGWTRSACSATTSKPASYAAGSGYTLTAEETDFYALYSYTEDGSTWYLTNFCQHEHTSQVTIDPTCEDKGAVQTVCDDCGAILESTPIPALGHDYEDTVVEPTCEDKGYTLHTCSRCDKSYRNSFVSALGHDYVDGVCTRCGAVDEDYQPPVDYPTYEDFTDLEAGQWYEDGITYALENGLMNGVGEGLFDPNGVVNRAMMVTILYRAEGEPSVEGMENPFEDVEADQWYTDAIIWAAENGIVRGVSDTAYAPMDNITREQIATILYRYDGESTDFEEEDLSRYPDCATVSSYALSAMKWAVGSGLINGMDGKLAPQENATRAQLATILSRYLPE